MPVYRHTEPAWLGYVSIPIGGSQVQPNGQTYQYINVNSGGNPATGAANAYPKVSGGPNNHTFFVALGEDATSWSVNRGLTALAKNDDFFDDLFNTDRVRPELSVVSIAAPSTTISLLPDTYLGPPGTLLTSSVLQQLFRVCNSLGEETVDILSNQHVLVQSCSLANSPASGYTSGGETITVSPALVVGSYRLLHYKRTSFALTNREFIRPPFLDGYLTMPGGLRVLLRDLRGDGADWDDTVEVSLRTLLVRGIDGVYRSSTSGPLPHALISDYFQNYGEKDTAGSGAFYKRDAQAWTGVSNWSLSAGEALQDPLGSMHTVILADANPGNPLTPYGYVAGSRGFVCVSFRPRSTNAGSSSYGSTLGSFAAYLEHRDEHSTTTQTPTRIDVPLSCTLQQVAGEDELTIIPSSTQHFSKVISSVNRTSLVIGWTLVEVSWQNPSDPLTTDEVRRVYRIKEIVSESKLRLLGPDASPAGFPAIARPGTITRILTPTMVVPDGLSSYLAKKGNVQSSVLVERGSLVAVAPPVTTLDVADQVENVEGAIYAGASGTSSSDIALTWGGYDNDISQPTGGKYSRVGYLSGNGRITCPEAVFPLATVTTLNAVTAVCAVGTITTCTITTASINTASIQALGAVSAAIDLLLVKRLRRVESSLNVSGIGVTVDLSAQLTAGNRAVVVFTGTTVINTISLPSVSLSPGCTFQILFDHRTAEGQMVDFTGVWPSTVKFKDPFDSILSAAEDWVDLFTFETLSDGTFLASVERYLP